MRPRHDEAWADTDRPSTRDRVRSDIMGDASSYSRTLPGQALPEQRSGKILSRQRGTKVCVHWG